MFIKAAWSNGAQSFYHAKKYCVDAINPQQVGQLICMSIDDGAHEIGIGQGDVVYIMNDFGKTIDTIRG